MLRALPVNSPVTPLSDEELAALATTGQSPERIREDEQRFGYQQRTADGRVIRIMGPSDD